MDASAPLPEQVLDILPDAVVVTDRDGIVTVWNREAEHLFGWAASEVLGERLPTVPDDQAWERRGSWVQELAAVGSFETTAPRRRRDGQLFDVVLRFRGVFAADELVAIVGTCRSAATEARLRESQRALDLVRRLSVVTRRLAQNLDVEASVSGIAHAAVELTGADFAVVSVPDGLGGYRRLATRALPTAILDDAVRVGAGLHGRVLETGATIVVDDYDAWEDALEAARGRDLRGAVAVPITAEGVTLGVLSVHSRGEAERFGEHEVEVLRLLAGHAGVAFVNASAYKRVSEERARADAILHSMRDGLAVVEDGVVTEWNRAAEEFTGLPATRVLGGPPPFDLDEASAGTELLTPDGNTRWVQTLAAPLTGGATVHLLRDITEQRQLEQAKDLFLATTSHELKTPLTVVKGVASTLRRYWERMTEKERTEAIDTILRRIDHLDLLTDRILVGSRVGAGVMEVRIGPVDVARVVADMVESFDAVSPRHEVRHRLPHALPLAAADRQAVDTVLGHLLENAVKYSPEGGQVVVDAKSTADGIELTVTDEGVGLDRALEELLQPFVQGDSRSTRRFGGVGIGLYIVRQLLDAMGSELTASNRSERPGARFCFTLPTWSGDGESDGEGEPGAAGGG